MKRIVLTVFWISIFIGISEYNTKAFSAAFYYLFFEYDQNTSGIIVESKRLRGGIGTDSYEVCYWYEVHDYEHLGCLVNFEAKSTDVQKTLSQYPVGKQVTVFYSASNARRSVLEKNGGLGLGVYVQFIIVLILIPVLFVSLKA